MFWPFTVQINCSSDLKNNSNSWPSASNLKSFSQSLKLWQNKKGQIFSQLPAVKKHHKTWPFLFCQGFSTFFVLTEVQKNFGNKIPLFTIFMSNGTVKIVHVVFPQVKSNNFRTISILFINLSPDGINLRGIFALRTSFFMIAYIKASYLLFIDFIPWRIIFMLTTWIDRKIMVLIWIYISILIIFLFEWRSFYS